jgi:hypothetical protein
MIEYMVIDDSQLTRVLTAGKLQQKDSKDVNKIVCTMMPDAGFRKMMPVIPA